jgi:hypothetical protein
VDGGIYCIYLSIYTSQPTNGVQLHGSWLGGIYERERAGKKKKKECHRRRKAKAFYSFFSLSL